MSSLALQASARAAARRGADTRLKRIQRGRVGTRFFATLTTPGQIGYHLEVKCQIYAN